MKAYQKRKVLPIMVAAIVMLSLPLYAMASDSVNESAGTVYVNDFADVLSDDTKADITKKSRALEELTGAQLVVVTVDFLGGEPIKDYTTDLFNKWQVGDSAKNNGLMLLLALGEEDYYAVQGKGLELDLSNTTISSVLKQYLETDFANGNYEAGVQKTYTQLLKKFEEIYGITDDAMLESTSEETSSQPDVETASKKIVFPFAVVILLLLLLLGVLLVVMQCRIARYRRKRARMESLRRTAGKS